MGKHNLFSQIFNLVILMSYDSIELKFLNKESRPKAIFANPEFDFFEQIHNLLKPTLTSLLRLSAQLVKALAHSQRLLKVIFKKTSIH